MLEVGVGAGVAQCRACNVLTAAASPRQVRVDGFRCTRIERGQTHPMSWCRRSRKWLSNSADCRTTSAHRLESHRIILPFENSTGSEEHHILLCMPRGFARAGFWWTKSVYLRGARLEGVNHCGLKLNRCLCTALGWDVAARCVSRRPVERAAWPIISTTV